MIFLRVSLSGANEEDIVLDQKIVTIGSDPANDVRLSGADVAPNHARIQFSDLQLIDLSGQGGTYLNRRQVSSATLENGDLIQIGPYEITFFHSHPMADGTAMDTTTWKLTRQEAQSSQDNQKVSDYPKTLKV